MDYKKAKTQDQGSEKHVPLVIENNNQVLVKVGSVLHPMEDNHYIEWIELRTNFDIYVKNLRPKDIPAASFEIAKDEYAMECYAYCNIHGLWKWEKAKEIKSSCMGKVYNPN